MALPQEEPLTSERGTRETDAVCERIDSTHYRVDGRELTLPLTIEDSTLLLNAFLVPAAAAQQLLDGTGLKVARVLPRQAALLLLGVDYRDNPLGDYNEVAVLVSALAPGQAGRTWLGTALSAALLRVPYFVYEMPVDQEFTAHAGRFLWGYPKYLADLDVRVGEVATARMSHEGSTVLAFTAKAARSTQEGAPRGGTLSERMAWTLTYRSGQLRRIAGHVSGHGLRWRLGGSVPELGTDHRLARELRALGLPRRPILSASLLHARMRFDVADPLSP